MRTVKRTPPIEESPAPDDFSGPERAPSVLILALLALGALLPFLKPHPLWGWTACAIVPGLLLARVLPPDPSRLVWMARVFLIGPVVTGLIATLLEVGHLRAAWPWTLTLYNLGSVALLLALERRSSRRHAAAVTAPPRITSPAPLPDSGLKTAAWIGLGLAIFVLLPEIVRPWVRERADSWFHAAVVAEIEHTGLPPQDPYFAGFRLQYMWFYHMVLFAFRQGTGMSAFWVMPILNALALWSFCVLAADVVISIGGSRRAAAWASALVPLGLSVLFWALFPIRVLKAFTGSARGGLAESFRLSPLDVPTTRNFMSEFGSVTFFLNKFIVGTAYGIALAFLLIYLAAIVRFAGQGRRIHLVTAGVALFAMLLVHPVAGLTVVAVSGLTGIVVWAMGRTRGGLSTSQVFAWGAAVLVPLLAAAPYLRVVTQGKPGEEFVPLHFDIEVALGIIAGCLLVIPVAIQPLYRMWRAARPAGRMFVIWTVMTVLFGFTIRLPGPNTTDKFTYLIYIPLGLAGASWVAEKWRGTRGLVIAILLLAPANIIGYSGYWGDADRREVTAESRQTYEWIASHTPRDAVFVENRERTGVLVRGPRRLYWGRETYAISWGYDPPSMARRRAVIAALYTAGAPVDPAVVSDLGSVGKSVYVIVRAEDFTSAGDFHKLDQYPALFQVAYETPGLRIYRFTG